ATGKTQAAAASTSSVRNGTRVRTGRIRSTDASSAADGAGGGDAAVAASSLSDGAMGNRVGPRHRVRTCHIRRPPLVKFHESLREEIFGGGPVARQPGQ